MPVMPSRDSRKTLVNSQKIVRCRMLQNTQTSRSGKSEIRNSKSETNSKPERRKPETPLSSFSSWDFGFVSDFEFRISDLCLAATSEMLKHQRIIGRGWHVA